MAIQQMSFNQSSTPELLDLLATNSAPTHDVDRAESSKAEPGSQMFLIAGSQRMERTPMPEYFLAAAALSRDLSTFDETTLQRALEGSNAFWQGWYMSGQIQFARKMFAAALKSFERSLQQSTEKASVYTAMGSCLQAMGKPQTALLLFKKALDEEPTNVTAIFNVASLYSQMEQKQAERDLLVHLLQIIKEKRNGGYSDPTSLCSLLSDVLDYQIKPATPTARDELPIAHVYREYAYGLIQIGEFDRAIDVSKILMDADGTDVAAMLYFGEAMLKARRTEALVAAAIRALENALDVMQDIEWWTDGCRDGEKEGTNHIGLPGKRKRLEGDVDDGRASTRGTLNRDKEGGVHLGESSESRLRLQFSPKRLSRQDLEQISKDPAMSGLLMADCRMRLKVQAHNNIAYGLSLLGRTSEALQELRKAFVHFPDDLEIVFNYCLLLHRSGHPKAASREWMQFRRIARGKPIRFYIHEMGRLAQDLRSEMSEPVDRIMGTRDALKLREMKWLDIAALRTHVTELQHVLM
ncbi:hypothetical protein HK104_005693 [Borealophlyctis nickersoniae]|nr:hypothetical protein HK104_005693 [Borealophlyctis nickersoniae]